MTPKIRDNIHKPLGIHLENAHVILESPLAIRRIYISYYLEELSRAYANILYPEGLLGAVSKLSSPTLL